MAEDTCQKYGNSKNFNAIVSEQLVVVDCTAQMRKKPKPKPKLSSLVISLAVVGALLMLMVGFVIYLFKTKKWKILHKSIFLTFNSSKGKYNADVEMSLISG